MSEALPPAGGEAAPRRKKVIQIKLVPKNPDSQPGAMGPLKPPANPPGVGRVASGPADDDGSVPARATIEPDALRDHASETRLIESANMALAQRQAQRSLQAAKDMAGHATLAMIRAAVAARLAAQAAWTTLRANGPAIAEAGGKITYDVVIAVVVAKILGSLTGTL